MNGVLLHLCECKNLKESGLVITFAQLGLHSHVQFRIVRSASNRARLLSARRSQHALVSARARAYLHVGQHLLSILAALLVDLVHALRPSTHLTLYATQIAAGYVFLWPLVPLREYHFVELLVVLG